MESSAKKVINTTELLEKILLNIETRMLLLSQRTSKAFRDTIADSNPLQRALYFQQEEAGNDTHTADIVDNPLLKGLYFRDLHIEGFLPAHLYIDNLVFHINYPYEKYLGFNGEKLTPAGDDKASWRRMYLRNAPQIGTIAGYRISSRLADDVSECRRSSMTSDETVEEMMRRHGAVCRREGKCMNKRVGGGDGSYNRRQKKEKDLRARSKRVTQE